MLFLGHEPGGAQPAAARSSFNFCFGRTMIDKRDSTALDLARVCACFMVVILHVAAVDFHVFDDRWWASNFYDSACRACVPVFLMISGALLLDRREALPVFVKKRFLRVVPPLLFWSLFYMAWNDWQGRHYGSWQQWLADLASGPVVFHLWYLYAVLGIYLFVPFLRAIWHASQALEKKAYLALWALVSAWPTLRAAWGVDADVLGTYSLGAFFGLSGYLFLGAWLHEAYRNVRNEPRYLACNAALFALLSLAIMAATYLRSRQTGGPDPLFYDYLSPLVMAASACAFNTLYGLGMRARRYARWLRQISACTLGVYCVHIFVLRRFESATGLPSAGVSPWWAIPFTAACVFAAALAAVMLLRRARVFRMVT
ncbi:acyltransferase [Candidimonas nitroreducens]|uniref:Acyltransferase 3 domain-containing protein n=1 Tax=Candidimonas nitroreducens TaxID=683354 RepID=A0A225MH23_9BURK|nr:acyltransferase family protein [Candidimonas nitroreducens]OWT60172.1 hypothetical protein CEY11_10915 [Candidimonas nitroreducens]